MTPLASTEALAAWTHDKDAPATTPNRTITHLECTQPAALHPPMRGAPLRLWQLPHLRVRQPAGPVALRLPKPDTRASLSGGRDASPKHPLARTALIKSPNHTAA